MKNNIFGVIFLPPANKVWGKVMFLHLCVILFTEGVCIQGGLYLVGVCIQGGLHRGDGQTPLPPPPIGCYGIQSTSGRYASYWNAFLSNYPFKVGVADNSDL